MFKTIIVVMALALFVAGCTFNDSIVDPEAVSKPADSNLLLQAVNKQSVPLTQTHMAANGDLLLTNDQILQPSEPPVGFHLTSPRSGQWFELGGDFHWTQLNNLPPGWTFYQYELMLFNQDTPPYNNKALFTRKYKPAETQIKVESKIRVGSKDGVVQGNYNWRVKANMADGQYSISAIEEWPVKIYDARVQGPGAVATRNNQKWYVDEYSIWGPYSNYVWYVHNVGGQKIAGPITSSPLSINQIPPVAYGPYWISVEVTFAVGRVSRTRLVNLK